VPVSVVEPKAVLGFDRPVRVLLAEDTEVNRRLVLPHADPAGAEVDTAENGRVASRCSALPAARRAATTSS